MAAIAEAGPFEWLEVVRVERYAPCGWRIYFADGSDARVISCRRPIVESFWPSGTQGVRLEKLCDFFADTRRRCIEFLQRLGLEVYE